MPAAAVQITMPESWYDEITRMAEESRTNRSEVVRSLMLEAIRAQHQGVLPDPWTAEQTTIIAPPGKRLGRPPGGILSPSAEDLAAACDLYEGGGQSLWRVAELAGIAQWRIREALVERGVEIRGRVADTAMPVDAVRAICATDLDEDTLATMLGVRVATVRWLRQKLTA